MVNIYSDQLWKIQQYKSFWGYKLRYRQRWNNKKSCGLLRHTNIRDTQ